MKSNRTFFFQNRKKVKYLSRDYRRERLRKEFAQYEVDRMCQRYNDECGECITRQATVGELNKVGRTENTQVKTYLDHSHAWWKETENKMYGRM